MQAEIVSVGTELLLGTIVDTNAAFLAQQLATLGIDCFHISQVGDNLGRISDTLLLAGERSDLIVMTGGMGPTQDDLARESIAAVLGETMTVDPELERELRTFFARRGVEMPEQNVKQATLIPSAEPLPNPVGTAPGWFVKWRRRNARTVVVVALPGVPFEMKRMWADQVVPRLGTSSGSALVSRTLKVLGPGESSVDAALADLMTGSNPTLAPYAKPDGIHLRITAKAADRDEAQQMVDRLDAQVRSRMGSAVYGADEESPRSVVTALLTELGLRAVLLEVGGGAVGALSPLVGQDGAAKQRQVVGAFTLADLGSLGGVLGVGERPRGMGSGGWDLEHALLSLVERSRTDLGLGTAVRTQPLKQTGGPVSAEAEIILVEAPINGTHGALRRTQTWRTEESEVPRLAGLASYNLLRLRLIELKAEEGGKKL